MISSYRDFQMHNLIGHVHSGSVFPILNLKNAEKFGVNFFRSLPEKCDVFDFCSFSFIDNM